LTVLLRGTPIGREEVNLMRTAEGWTISSIGRLAPPLDLTTSRFEVRYATDWQPIEMRLEATLRNRPFSIVTSFGVTTAVNEITHEGRTTAKTDQVTARTIVLPNNFFAAYEALAARVVSAAPGTELRAYIAPQTEIPVLVKEVAPETIRMPDRAIAVRRVLLSFQNPGGVLDAQLWVDDRSRLARLEIPAVSLQVVREELATIAARQETIRHPGDETVTIPASGFNLAGTLTRPGGPAAARRLRLPAVVLVGGSGPADRDEIAYGVPIFGQLAGALADAGFIVVRYDRRGVGQSGGRTESATLADYAEDVRAAVKYLSKRRDVDKRRIAVLGHSEGGSVAMLAAARDESIAALILVAAIGTTGADLVLEQQRQSLERMKVSEAEKQQKIELQKKIQAAALGHGSWEGIPPQYQQQADTPWFQSLLAFDPAKVTPRLRQPILIIHGSLDTQVPPHHAARLAELARARKKGGRAELEIIPGVNHLLVPAKTGDLSEYGQLERRTISDALVARIIEWLRATL
jgi:hypothetical protein